MKTLSNLYINVSGYDVDGVCGYVTADIDGATSVFVDSYGGGVNGGYPILTSIDYS